MFLLAVCTAGLFAASAAPAAQATTHDYCNWDSSYVTSPAVWSLCSAGAVWLTNNIAWLPYGETDSAIYCGAASNGTQYGSNTVGTTYCEHAYAGSTWLSAYMFIGPVSHAIHGLISY